MGTVEQFPKPLADGVDQRWTSLKWYEPTEDGQRISLVQGLSKSGVVSYGVLIMGAEDAGEPFDIIVEYGGNPEGRAAAEIAADIADRTLGASCGLMPEPA